MYMKYNIYIVEIGDHRRINCTSLRIANESYPHRALFKPMFLSQGRTRTIHI